MDELATAAAVHPIPEDDSRLAESEQGSTPGDLAGVGAHSPIVESMGTDSENNSVGAAPPPIEDGDQEVTNAARDAFRLPSTPPLIR